MKHKTKQHGIKIGDLVKMKLGYSAPGIVIKIMDIPHTGTGYRLYAQVQWSDYGKGLEKVRDLEVINESR